MRNELGAITQEDLDYFLNFASKSRIIFDAFQLELTCLDISQRVLDNAIFREASMAMAIAVGSSFRSTNFRDAECSFGYFADCCFDGADLRGANFEGSVFRNTSFKNTLTKGAIGLPALALADSLDS